MAQHKTYKAFLFDLNGTMVNDMNYHITAWHSILIGLGAQMTLRQMKEECYGKNGEMLERVFPGRFTEEEKESLGNQKETAYRKGFRPQLKLIDGLLPFFITAHQNNIKMAIGSAAILSNVDFVLDGLSIRQYIDAIVCAGDVTDSKPHPETFLKCAKVLNMPAADCLVFEDAPKGVEAAAAAGMDCIVITTMHTEDEFSGYSNIPFFITDYHDQRLQQLLCSKEQLQKARRM